MDTIPNEILQEILILVTMDIKVDYLIDLMTVNKLWHETLDTFMFYIYATSHIYGFGSSNMYIRSNNSDKKLAWNNIPDYLVIYMKNYPDEKLCNTYYLNRKERHYMFADTIVNIADELNIDITKMKFFCNTGWGSRTDKIICVVDFYTKYDLLSNKEILDKLEYIKTNTNLIKLVNLFFGLIKLANNGYFGQIDQNIYSKNEKVYHYFEKLYNYIKNPNNKQAIDVVINEVSHDNSYNEIARDNGFI